MLPAPDPDHRLRRAAVERARELSHRYGDLVPRDAVRAGFQFEGERVSFGSLQRGIFRARVQRGPAALSLFTAPAVPGKARPYDDEVDPASGAFLYHYRAGPVDQPDNRALRAAGELRVPLVYIIGIAPSQYYLAAPVFVTHDDPAERVVLLEAALPVRDTEAGGLVSGQDVRAYATREVRSRLHQQRFRADVLRAYRERCAICALRERTLVEAAHILGDTHPEGFAAVVNGIALCAIHHLAYDRNLLGIDPEGVVHIAPRLREERDGPMLREGLQGFHGRSMSLPRRPADRPDPHRLELRFEEFRRGAA